MSTRMTIKGRSPIIVNEKFVCFIECGGKDILVHKNEAGFPFMGQLKVILAVDTLPVTIMCHKNRTT